MSVASDNDRLDKEIRLLAIRVGTTKSELSRAEFTLRRMRIARLGVDVGDVVRDAQGYHLQLTSIEFPETLGGAPVMRGVVRHRSGELRDQTRTVIGKWERVGGHGFTA